MAAVAARSTGSVGVGAVIFISVALTTYFISKKKKKKKKESRKKKKGLVDAIGNTPLIRINSLSAATGCQVTMFSMITSLPFSFPILLSTYFYFSSDSRQVRVLKPRRQRQRPRCCSNYSRG